MVHHDLQQTLKIIHQQINIFRGAATADNKRSEVEHCCQVSAAGNSAYGDAGVGRRVACR